MLYQLHLLLPLSQVLVLVATWAKSKIIIDQELLQVFAELVWISKEQRQSLKLLEPRSFDMHKNAAASMIAMLDYLELDTEVWDAGIKTTKSNYCRGVSRNNRNTNGMLATMQGGVRFSCKDRWKFINPFTQSISGLCQVSQLYPRTKEQEESSRVT